MSLLPAVLIGMLLATRDSGPPAPAAADTLAGPVPAPAVADTLATLDPLADLQLEIPASSFT